MLLHLKRIKITRLRARLRASLPILLPLLHIKVVVPPVFLPLHSNGSLLMRLVKHHRPIHSNNSNIHPKSPSLANMDSPSHIISSLAD
jgi:hypothetical protein